MPSTTREEVKSNNPPPTGRREGAHVIIDRNCCCGCLSPQDKKFGIGLLLSDACAGDAAGWRYSGETCAGRAAGPRENTPSGT